MFIRFRYFGFASGDSYIWSLSPRIVNTLFWYGVWSLNIPEMFVDFVGPKLQINPNLLKYWSNEVLMITSVFVVNFIVLSFLFVNYLRNKRKKMSMLFLLIMGFILSLGPVLLLPLHKYTFYLTVPMVFVSLFISILIIEFKKSKSVLMIFITFWIIGSLSTLNLTKETNWITTGAHTAVRVKSYFDTNYNAMQNKSINFKDSVDDQTLPWSPTEVLSNVLSKNNFFEVFYPNLVVYYGNENADVVVYSRQFLGY